MLPANVSVIITRYNKPPEQVDECIESIRNQTVPVKEIILVDDASETRYAHPEVTTIILPKNIGVGQARAVGVKMSVGKLLLFVDADDKLALDFVQQCGKVIAKADIAYSNFIMFGDGFERPKLTETPEVLDPTTFLTHCPIRVTSMMHRKVYEEIGGFSDLPMFEDWEFWIRAMCNGYSFAKANTLFHYRRTVGSRNHVDSVTKSEAISEMTAPYEVVDGVLKVKEPHGR